MSKTICGVPQDFLNNALKYAKFGRFQQSACPLQCAHRTAQLRSPRSCRPDGYHRKSATPLFQPEHTDERGQPREVHEAGLVLAAPRVKQAAFNAGSRSRLQGVVEDLLKALDVFNAAPLKWRVAAEADQVPGWANPGRAQLLVCLHKQNQRGSGCVSIHNVRTRSEPRTRGHTNTHKHHPNVQDVPLFITVCGVGAESPSGSSGVSSTPASDNVSEPPRAGRGTDFASPARECEARECEPASECDSEPPEQRRHSWRIGSL